MDAIIYKTKLSDFVKELDHRSSAKFYVYITTTKRLQEKGAFSYEVVLSAFNLQDRVIHLRTKICKAIINDSEANAKAESRTKAQAANIESQLLKYGFCVSSGIVGSLATPIYGIIDDVSEPVGAMD